MDPLEETFEQAEVETEPIESPEAVEPQGTLDDVFADALTEKATAQEDDGQVEEDEAKEQVKDSSDKETAETPFGEIIVSDAQKIAFKNEKEFQDFLEKNPLLREGFMKSRDYTHKTSQVAQERKQLDEQKKAFETEQSSIWGQQKPTKEDMGFFKDFWKTFQYGTPEVAQRLASIAQDVSLIAQGRPPVGPLAVTSGTPVDYTLNSELIKNRRDIDEMRAEREREKAEYAERIQSEDAARGKAEIDSWVAGKQSKGIQITTEEFAAMAPLSRVLGEDGKRLYSLDEMYKLALAKLGKTEQQALKKVHADSKMRSSKTPSRPASRVPSSAKLDSSNQNLDEIFQEAQEQLAQG